MLYNYSDGQRDAGRQVTSAEPCGMQDAAYQEPAETSVQFGTPNPEALRDAAHQAEEPPECARESAEHPREAGDGAIGGERMSGAEPDACLRLGSVTTDAGLLAQLREAGSVRDLEQRARRSGYSRTQAKALAARARGLDQEARALNELADALRRTFAALR